MRGTFPSLFLVGLATFHVAKVGRVPPREPPLPVMVSHACVREKTGKRPPWGEGHDIGLAWINLD